jgi:hypothetical protein
VKIRQTRPDYVVIQLWGLRNDIMEQASWIRSWGRQFEVPIQDVKGPSVISPEPPLLIPRGIRLAEASTVVLMPGYARRVHHPPSPSNPAIGVAPGGSVVVL